MDMVKKLETDMDYKDQELKHYRTEHENMLEKV